ncbi:MAG: DUF1549 and DUF1553 domain-containing protein [Pirellulales bacterium]|nr:DUF1549 and DUF1553 domain-containing protein [Pirellulales bacterium]
MKFTSRYLGLLLITLMAIPGNAQDAPFSWAFTTPDRPVPPAKDSLTHGHLVNNPIDAFIQKVLDRKKLTPVTRADRTTLVRRAYFDLIGLPPTPEQINQFVNNPSPKAWEELINELLEKPEYGERWARHWLDVARYADSQGFEGDNSIPNAWRYRDYVIKSLNDDKPYDIFVQEQIAADEIWPDNLDLDPKRVYLLSDQKKKHLEARIGTGFYNLNAQVHESALDAHRLQYETLTDWVDTTASVFMGLTMGCARCHDHKFDPLSQEDYFGMQAIFAPSEKQYLHLHTPMMRGDWHWLYPRRTAVEEAKRALKAFRATIAGLELTEAEKAQEQTLKDAIVNSVMLLPDNANSVPQEPFDILMTSPTATVLGHTHPKLLKPVHFLDRGELELPKHVVGAKLPKALAIATNSPSDLSNQFESRKALALWLTNGKHPLTSRVMINRLWQWHFGRGIVATPNDFGLMGAAPTHPDLLDWLASEFITRDWSLKEMHRLIMKSNTYQADSRTATDNNLAIDPENKYLWRMNRRRLEAEALWDSVHFTAGTLTNKLYGRPVVPSLSTDEMAALREKWHWPVSGDPSDHTRRGIYILVKRNFRFPMFEVYDAPLTELSCPQRDVTTVATQAQWTLNSPSVYKQAQHLAAVVLAKTGDNPEVWSAELWLRVLGRQISKAELAEILTLIKTLESDALKFQPDKETADLFKTITPARAAAYVHTCLALFNHNEFSFID